MAEQDPSRASSVDEQQIIQDDDTLARRQKGYHKRPSFFGDISEQAEYGTFVQAVGTAMNFAGFRNSQVVEEREEAYLLTAAEIREIERLASYISQYGDVKFSAVRTFLIILCYVDNITDMTKIANTLEIDELKEPSIIRNPSAILGLRDLYKVAFLANALDALIEIYSRFIPRSDTKSSKTTSSDAIQNFISLAGGSLGSGVASMLEIPDATEALGHFMSELIQGTRIPTTIIAKNPMKQSPSYSGQALFGESPNALSLIDIIEDFPKKIAVFPKPTNGAGKSSFSMQNGGITGNITQVVNQLVFDGGDIVANTFKAARINEIVDRIKANTGVTDNEKLESKHADVGLPLQIELSAVLCNTDKSPFGTKVFQDGWEMSCAISNYMQNNNPEFLKVIRENET